MTITANIYMGISITRTDSEIIDVMRHLRNITGMEGLEDAILIGFHRVAASDRKLARAVQDLRDIRLCAQEGQTNISGTEMDRMYEAVVNE
ncbi:MAG: hypothetical protein ACYC69_02750 [Thermodesulfovibrionales bacterium]